MRPDAPIMFKKGGVMDKEINHDSEDAGYHFYELGCESMGNEDYAAALSHFLSSLDASGLHYKSYQRIGDCLIHLGRTKEALLYLLASIGLHQYNEPARLQAAVLLDQMGETDHAIDLLEKGLKMNPNNKKFSSLVSELIFKMPQEWQDVRGELQQDRDGA